MCGATDLIAIIWRKGISLLSAFSLGGAASAHSTTLPVSVALYRPTSVAQVFAQHEPTPHVKASTRSASPLRIDNVRLEPAAPTETSPSTIVKFDMRNEDVKSLTDVVVRVSIVEKREPDRVLAPQRMLAGPFTIRGKIILESGHTINYEMLLRNLSPDCACVAKVDVMSVRALPLEPVGRTAR